MKALTSTSRPFRAAFFSALCLLLFCNFSLTGTAGQPHEQEENTAAAKKIKIALLLDTSNSMDGLIDQAKSQLWNLVQELSRAKVNEEKPQLEIALYEYGNASLSAREGYIRMVTPLTYDLDKISEDLFRLTTNGGSEHCGQVIRTACMELDWQPQSGDYQVIFIAGNEPFTQGPVNFREACGLAKEKNIFVNTIYCGPHQDGIASHWKSGADITGGSYMNIDHDQKTVYVSSPYDDRINELNLQLNNTYIVYGGRAGSQKKANQEIQDQNAMKYGKENMVQRAVSKSTHVYKNDSWDLIDASSEKGFDLSRIKTEELPENMRRMSQEEKLAYIALKKQERELIRNQIAGLNQKRLTYVATQQKSSDKQTLETVMIKSIRKQAASKNLTF